MKPVLSTSRFLFHLIYIILVVLQQANASSSSTVYDFVKCATAPCDEIIAEFSLDEIKDISNEMFEEFSIMRYMYGLDDKFGPLLKYGVQLRKICSSCTDYDLEQEPRCFQDFCGSDVYGNDATVSGIIAVPIIPDESTDNTSSSNKILPGLLKVAVWSLWSRYSSCWLPAEQWEDSLADGGDKSDFFQLLLTASNGNLAFAGTPLGYGESYDYMKSYQIRRAYQNVAVPLLKKAQHIIATETNCQTEVSDSIVISGYSEGGFGSVATAEAMECAGYDIIKLQAGGGSFRLSSTIYETLKGADNDPEGLSWIIFLFGVAYSAENPGSGIDGNQNLLADESEWMTPDGLRTFTRDDLINLSAGYPPWNENDWFDVLYAPDPVSVINPTLVKFFVDANERGDVDPCLNPDVDKTGVDKICEALVNNDVRDYIDSITYPVELCQATRDKITPIGNVLPYWEEYHKDVMFDFWGLTDLYWGPHSWGALSCNFLGFTSFFTSDDFTSVSPKSSGLCPLHHEENNNNDISLDILEGINKKTPTPSMTPSAKESSMPSSLPSSMPSSMPSFADVHSTANDE